MIKNDQTVIPDYGEYITKPNELEQEIIYYAIDCCKALGFTSGICVSNLKLDKNDKPVLLEINFRINGYDVDLNPIK